MDCFKIEILQSAYDELNEIFEYILLDSPQNASNLLDRVFSRLHHREQFPESGTKLSDKALQKYGFRTIVDDPCIIFYNIDLNCQAVYIHHILHGARDWFSVLKN